MFWVIVRRMTFSPNLARNRLSRMPSSAPHIAEPQGNEDALSGPPAAGRPRIGLCQVAKWAPANISAPEFPEHRSESLPAAILIGGKIKIERRPVRRHSPVPCGISREKDILAHSSHQEAEPAGVLDFSVAVFQVEIFHCGTDVIHLVFGDKVMEDLGKPRPAAHAAGDKDLEAAGDVTVVFFVVAIKPRSLKAASALSRSVLEKLILNFRGKSQESPSPIILLLSATAWGVTSKLSSG